MQEVPNTKKKFEQLKFDIKLKDFEIIKKDREEALKVDSLINPHKVNAKIQWNNKTYDAKIRLKGWGSEHWLYSKQWSFRVLN